MKTETPQLVISRLFDRQAFTKLDATLMNVQAVTADHRGGEAWQS